MLICYLNKAIACFVFTGPLWPVFFGPVLRKLGFRLSYVASDIGILEGYMTHCEIQFHPSTGQMTVSRGAHLLDSLFEGRQSVHAVDRATGHRYIITQSGEELTTNRVTVH